VNVAELHPGSASCGHEEEEATNVTLTCELTGTVNPWGIPGTEVWFEAGSGASLAIIGAPVVLKEPVGNVPVGLSGSVVVRPNEASFYYRLASYDASVKAPERALISERASFATPMVAPRVVEQPEPEVESVTASSADLRGELNPENASTEYFFEYGPGKALEECSQGVNRARAEDKQCAGVLTTDPASSGEYGAIGATFEARYLQPATTYHYRLFAESENVGKSERRSAMSDGSTSFTTVAAPVVQAVTGSVTGVGTTGATVSGSVDPDGQPATYRFEVGVYAGSLTQYGIVFTGITGNVNTLESKSFLLSGLQPGTTYAYRIVLQSGYGVAEGAPASFTTEGLPAVLVTSTPLAQLPLPAVAFPDAVVVKPGKGIKAKSKKSKKKQKGNSKQKRPKQAKKGKRK
jgi:hypothetical protein